MDIATQISQLRNHPLDPVGAYQKGKSWAQQKELNELEIKRRQQEQEMLDNRRNNLLPLAEQAMAGDERAWNALVAQDPQYADQIAQARATGRVEPKVYNMTPGGALVSSSGEVLFQNQFKPAGGEQAGGPFPSAPTSPFQGFSDPKKADELRKFYAQEGYKDLRDMSEQAATSAATIRDIDRFLYLNEGNYTGTGMSLPGVSMVRAGFDPEFAEMKSISDRLTPRMRQGMPGAASDKDVAMFRGATISVDKPPEANKNIGQGLKIAEKNAVDRYQFMQTYYRKQGNLLGAEEAWQGYLEANPIFDHEAPEGSYRLNKNRASWRQHFGLEKKKKTPKDLHGYREKIEQTHEPDIDALLKKYGG